MGTPYQPLPVKLIIGFIYRDPVVFEKTRTILRRIHGDPDIESPKFSFDKTSYYEKEMGQELQRKFLSYKRLIPAEKLVAIKIATNALEKKLEQPRNHRAINIDPGYVTLSKLVLATTKNFAHRLYAGRGIFEEVTLFYKDNSFEPGRWTYPDFREKNHIGIFNDIRKHYLDQLTKTYGLSQLYRCV
jgi:hypothetical protein